MAAPEGRRASRRPGLEPHLRTAPDAGSADVQEAPRRAPFRRRFHDRPSTVPGFVAAVVAAGLAAAVTAPRDGLTVTALALAAVASCCALLAWSPAGDGWEPRPAWRSRVIAPITAAAWIGTLAAVVDGHAGTLARPLAIWWAFAVILALLLEPLARALVPPPTERTLVVGTDPAAEAVARKLRRHPEYRIDVAGPVSAATADARAFDRIVVAGGDTDTRDVIDRLARTGVRIDIVPVPATTYGRFGVTTVEELSLIRVPASSMSAAERTAKRAIDVVGAALALIATAPLFAVIAIAIKRGSPGPVLFRQTRLGEDMREFTNLKFRTMRTDAPQDIHRGYIKSSMTTDVSPEANGLYKLERESDITGIGRWLRRTSLDELPQFWNVLRGDISLVGPRPCIPYEVEFFEPRHYDRFLVPAGITGLWQVTARARSTFGEALDIDVAYAHSRSLRLDLGILLRTPLQLLRLRSTA